MHDKDRINEILMERRADLADEEAWDVSGPEGAALPLAGASRSPRKPRMDCHDPENRILSH